jgi:transposase
MDEIRRAQGRPMVHDLRAMVDAIGYVVRNGIEWRALPADFWEHRLLQQLRRPAVDRQLGLQLRDPAAALRPTRPGPST